MLKDSSKRRRTKAQIKAEKEAEANREAEIQKKMAFLAEAQEKLNTFEQMEDKYEQAREVLQKLQAAGVVDVDSYGNISPSK